jgi:hypothetical protein
MSSQSGRRSLQTLVWRRSDVKQATAHHIDND